MEPRFPQTILLEGGNGDDDSRLASLVPQVIESVINGALPPNLTTSWEISKPAFML